MVLTAQGSAAQLAAVNHECPGINWSGDEVPQLNIRFARVKIRGKGAAHGLRLQLSVEYSVVVSPVSGSIA